MKQNDTTATKDEPSTKGHSMTHHPLRRAERALSDGDARAVLDTVPYVSIAAIDADGVPYSVPLSFVRKGNTLYFHATNEGGHKTECFRHEARVCASAVTDVQARFEGGDFTTSYSSAVAFGRVREVTDGVEFRHALVALCMKYVPEAKREIGGAMEREMANTSVWAIDIETLTGKANPSATH